MVTASVNPVRITITVRLTVRQTPHPLILPPLLPEPAALPGSAALVRGPGGTVYPTLNKVIVPGNSYLGMLPPGNVPGVATVTGVASTGGGIRDALAGVRRIRATKLRDL